MASKSSIGPGLARHVAEDLRRNIRPLFACHLFFAGLATVIAAPVSSVLLAASISPSGRLTVSNEEIAWFLMSPVGLCWMALVGTGAGVLFFAEHAGMIWILWRRWRGEPASSTGALWRIGRRFPGLLLLSAVQVGAHLILLVPFLFLAIGAVRFFTVGYDMEHFIASKPGLFWMLAATLLLLAGASGFAHGSLYFRWIFSAPALHLEGLAPLEALRHSSQLTRGLRWKIVPLVIGAGALVAGIGPLLLFLFDASGAWILERVPERPVLVAVTMLLFLAGHLLLAVTLAFLTVAIHASVIANLFDRVLSRRLRATLARIEPSSPEPLPGRRYLPWRLEVAALLGALGFAALILGRVELTDRTAVTAHRGSSHRAPENTLASLEQAILDGADYAEVDLQELADGTLILFHDADLLRIAGLSRPTHELRHSDILQIDAGSHFAPEFAGERIPTLAEAIRLARSRIKLNIELKVHGHERRLARGVVETLQREQFKKDAIITSLNLEVLRQVRRLDPDLQVGFIAARSLGGLERLDVDLLSVSSRVATPRFVVAAQRAGKQLHVWTVNRPKRMAYFIDIGVDNIITDRPDLLVALLEERAELSDFELLLIRTRHWLQGHAPPAIPATRGW